MQAYDIAVIGGGAAGSMAAIRASQLNARVILIERNESICRKILLTGKGRCNVTNIADIDAFIEKFGKQGHFLRSAFSVFFNKNLISFFESKGLKLKIERQGRVFPITNEASSIVRVLNACLAENKVNVLYGKRLRNLTPKKDFFELELENSFGIDAKKVILSTGGASYRATGSTGDGFKIAAELGHSIIPPKPALVPLKTKEPWVKELQGLSLKNIRVTFEYGKKRMASNIGELIFTHFGVSGPLILDLSGQVICMMDEYEEVPFSIDLKPGLEVEQLENRLLKDFKAGGNTQFKNFMKDLLPNSLVPVFVRLSKVDPSKKVNQITQKERIAIMALLKSLPLTIVGSLPIEEAMVTAGGVSTKEIDPKTMESKIVPGLFLAGEIIDGSAPSGGYNLQQAFSTGYLAGEKAATCVK